MVSTVQNDSTVVIRPSRRVTSEPPTRITAYASTIAGLLIGAHQKSSGSTRVLPSTMNAMTSPTLDGLKTCDPLRRTMNLVKSENAAIPENIHHW